MVCVPDLVQFLCMVSSLYTTIFSSVPQPEVQQTVNQQVAELIAWSLDCASAGVAPCRGFKDEPFPRHSARFKMAGQKLACGWKNLYCHSINFSILQLVLYK
jgi:hypothetical protein